MNIKDQRKFISSIVRCCTGKKLKKLKSGRPFIDKKVDISISHKNNLFFIGIVHSPYRVGVDVELIQPEICISNFINKIISKKELLILKNYCKKKRISDKTGFAIFWSLKESFFKCLDYDLVPLHINIVDISEKKEVTFRMSYSIKTKMKERHLIIIKSSFFIKKEYVFSKVVMLTRS